MNKETIRKIAGILFLLIALCALGFVIFYTPGNIENQDISEIERKFQDTEKEAEALAGQFKVIMKKAELQKKEMVSEKAKGEKKIRKIYEMSDPDVTRFVERWLNVSAGEKINPEIPQLLSLEQKKNMSIFFQNTENLEKQIDFDWQYIRELEAATSTAATTIQAKDETIKLSKDLTLELKGKIKKERKIRNAIIAGVAVVVLSIIIIKR